MVLQISELLPTNLEHVEILVEIKARKPLLQIIKMVVESCVCRKNHRNCRARAKIPTVKQLHQVGFASHLSCDAQKPTKRQCIMPYRIRYFTFLWETLKKGNV